MHADHQKAFKGTGMEGWVARWYTRTRLNDMADFRREAKAVADRLRGIFRHRACQAAKLQDHGSGRVLRPGCEAVVVDLCKDASLDEIATYVTQSGRSRIDAWMTKWTFRHILLKRAYSKDEFVRMARQSRFGACQIKISTIGFEVRFAKPAYPAAEAS